MKIWFCAAFALFLLGTSEALAKEYVQRYIRPSDKKVLYEFSSKNGETVNTKELGDLMNTAGGEKYREVLYRVFEVTDDNQEEMVNEQLVWFWPNAPKDGDDTRSNYWIYWCKPLKDGKGRIWGRCPTPKHPKYEEWKQGIGVDLWQVVPANKRAQVPDDADPDKAVKSMARNADDTPKIIGETDNDMPRVVPKDRDPGADKITCVRFDNFFI